MVSGFERNWICAPKLCCSICLHFKDGWWRGTAYLCLSWCILNWEYTENRTAGHPIKKFSHFHLLLFWLHIIICPQDAALLRNRNFKALITFLLLFLEMNSFLSHVLSYYRSAYIPQWCQSSISGPKTTNSWKAWKLSNFYFCVKLDYF